MSTDQEVIRIGKQLEKAVQADEPNEGLALDLLKTLQDLPMNLDLLQKSRIGLSVNTLRKKCSGSEVASLGKKLIKQWKKLVQTTPDNNSTAPSTPPPVTYTSKPTGTLATPSSTTNGTSDTTGNPNTPLSPIIPCFPPGINSNRRIDVSGDVMRDRCREMLYKSLMKGLAEVSIEDDTRIYNISAEIESCIFNEMRSTNNKYKTRVRSRVSNLGDLKNPGLKQNVLSGQINIQRISTMPTDEMASEEMKKLRKHYTKEAIRDSQMAVTEGTKTDLLKCSKCGKRNATYNQMQTRSADEPMTTFCYCNECGHRWKFC